MPEIFKQEDVAEGKCPWAIKFPGMDTYFACNKQTLDHNTHIFWEDDDKLDPVFEITWWDHH